jgi:SAM-dependent methyltransferase
VQLGGEEWLERPTWFIDEVAHSGPEHLDPDYVAVYDRKAGFDPSADVEQMLKLGLDQTSTLVDLGAGTGAVSFASAPRCRRVVVVDVSGAMLRTVAAKADRLGVRNVEVVRAGFLSYDHQGPPADFVYSRNALHHLPDFWKVVALQRVAAILRPGGVFFLRDLVYSCRPEEVSTVFENWLANAIDRPELGWTRPELETHIRDEYSTFSWLLEPMLERVGFRIQQADHSDSRTYSLYVCIKG